MNLIVRISQALDFLSQMQRPDGTFVSAFVKGQASPGPTKVVFHLQAISLLCSCAEILDKKHLIRVADRAFDQIKEHTFIHNNEACLIVDNQSFSYWNALMGLLHFRKGFISKATPFLESIQQCMKGKILAQYKPGTAEEYFKDRMQGPAGVIAIAFLEAGKPDDAVHAANHILKSGRFDYLDTWALRLLWDHLTTTGDRPGLVEEYQRHVSRYIQMMSNIDPKTLNSFTAATTQQALLAWADKYDVKKQCDAILERQIRFQDLDSINGGFVRDDDNSDIRLEYLIHNTVAYLEYMMRFEQDRLITPDIII